MRSRIVGQDTEEKHNRARWLIVILIILILFIIVLTGGHSEAAAPCGGACQGYSSEPAIVIAFHHVPFSHMVTVRVGQNVYGTRYTLRHYIIGQAVHVSGIACQGTLRQFRMW